MHERNRNVPHWLVAPLAAALLLATGTARALPPGVVLEGSVETSTDAVILPGDANGRITVRGCDNCVHSTIQLDANTQFVLGGERLGLREFAQYALRNPGHALTIHYRLKDTVATRVSVLVR